MDFDEVFKTEIVFNKNPVKNTGAPMCLKKVGGWGYGSEHIPLFDNFCMWIAILYYEFGLFKIIDLIIIENPLPVDPVSAEGRSYHQLQLRWQGKPKLVDL